MEENKDPLRENFMKPQNNEPIVQREKFAVSLRKVKKQQILEAKRLKVNDSLSKKRQLCHKQFADDEFLSLEELESGVYKGYPKWRQVNYKE